MRLLIMLVDRNCLELTSNKKMRRVKPEYGIAYFITMFGAYLKRLICDALTPARQQLNFNITVFHKQSQTQQDCINAHLNVIICGLS